MEGSHIGFLKVADMYVHRSRWSKVHLVPVMQSYEEQCTGKWVVGMCHEHGCVTAEKQAPLSLVVVLILHKRFWVIW